MVGPTARGRAAVLTLAVATGLGLLLVTSSPAVATGPGGNGKLVALKPSSNDEMNIWVLNLDGTGRQQLTDGWRDGEPEWSPDGSKIAFVRQASAEDGLGEIWTINANGTGLDRVTYESRSIARFDWSADGTKFVYSATVDVYESDVFVVDADGTNRKQLTFSGGGLWPQWSPDGSRIAYYDLSDASAKVVSPTGVFLSDFDYSQCVPMDWSPDQRWILCQQEGDGTWAEIELVYADDSPGVIRINDNDVLPGEYNVLPAFSPDGAWLIWQNWSIFSEDPPQLYLEASHGHGTPTPLFPGEAFQEVDWQPNPALRFADILGSTFWRDINWLADEGITSGCGLMRFCPAANVTREQMASFLVRALDLPPTGADFFTDDEASSHESDINRLAAAGITTGCSPTMFCPTATVTRAQMASFLARAFELPATATDYFTDDETSSHEANINRVRAAGITTGCTATSYCPAGIVTRGQMAAFLHRALD